MTAPKPTPGDGLRRLDSGKWQARYVDKSTGKRVSLTHDTKAKAKAWREAQIGAQRAGSHVDPTDKTTVAQYARRWAEVRDVRASTAARYASIIRTHLDGQPLGAMRLGDVKATHVREWLTDRSAVLAPMTVQTVFTFVRAVFDGAQHDGLIARSPARSVKAKPAGRSTKAYRREVLTDEQVEALREAMPGRYDLLVLICATAGLRVGEALALRVEDVDLVVGEIAVTLTLAPNGKTAGSVKSDATSVRQVPIPRSTVTSIKRHMLAYPPLDHPTLGRLLFSTPTGLPVRYHRLRSQFEQAAIKAKVPGCTPHSLRHRAGSVMLDRGTPETTVARIMGHTLRMLQAVYAHPLPQGDDVARAAMELRAPLGTRWARPRT